ncbi:MAG: rhomboid family intramembrane serine protease [Prolixibacteraceae bacterium]|jgi:membrane associated rhomboid family serine protease|nr:rhomboid family intramembrane serine protease [Prolixibacteraceae bacterium]
MPLFNYYPRNTELVDKDLDKKIFKYSLLIPLAIVVVFWVVKLIENLYQLDFSKFGILPLQAEGLPGIILSPFIHSNYDHLLSNSIPFLILTFALLYFYRNLAYRIFFLIYILSGICVWLGGRPSWHIGASGIVYGLASFLFFSGALRRDANLLTIGIIVVFLYGSMFWGIFPLKPEISWESHLWGAASGLMLAIYYRHQGPVRPAASWENEPEEDDSDYTDEEFNEEITPEEDQKNPNHIDT